MARPSDEENLVGYSMKVSAIPLQLEGKLPFQGSNSKQYILIINDPETTNSCNSIVNVDRVKHDIS